MFSKTGYSCNSLLLLNLFLLIGPTLLLKSDGLDTSRKLDEEKCTPCTSTPPPPPPPSPPPPCPPPPALPPPVLPPPTPKKPPSSYCPPPPPPPPSSGLIYTTGPPGSLYPIDTDFSGSPRRAVLGFPSLISCGLLGLLMLLISFGN